MAYIAGNSAAFFAFNIWDTESARAVIDAGEAMNRDVILQTSSTVFEMMDKDSFYAWFKAYMAYKGIKAYLHLDHCRNKSLICQAVDAGWDSVMFDGSQLDLTANISITKEIVQYAHAAGCLVEAEVGYIGKTNHDNEQVDRSIASLKDISCFLQETDVDLFAAAFGTAHGLYKGEPVLYYDVIDYISEISDVPFVVHGGTGLSDEAFKELLLHENVKKINISTDVKQAYRDAVAEAWQKGDFQKTGFEAVRIEKMIYDYIVRMAKKKLILL